jgi:hypothetical protein
MAKYVIVAGSQKPAPVIAAHPNKDGSPGPNAQEATRTVGAYFLVNRCRVWARRVLPSGKPDKVGNDEVVLELTDSRYKGHLEFLEYGSMAAGAQQIEIRYLTSSRSLDFQYQDLILKIKTDPERDGTALIQLEAGENKFDTVKDELIVQMLKVHPSNRDSKSKNPDPQIKGYLFYELTDEKVDKSYIESSEKAIDAGLFVKEMSDSPEQLKNLLFLFKKRNIDFGGVDENSLDTDIYKALLAFSRNHPNDFTSILGDAKKQISDCFVKAKGFDVLDVTKNGVVSVVVAGAPPEIVFSKLEGKGLEMETYILKNICKPEIYAGIERFKQICEGLK